MQMTTESDQRVTAAAGRTAGRGDHGDVACRGGHGEDIDLLGVTVRLRPGTGSLLRLLSTLHHRGATVRIFDYETGPAHATAVVTMSLPRGRAHHVRTTVAQLVEVLDVEVLHQNGGRGQGLELGRGS
ncbi:MAG: hypothetical protein FWJ90_12315 [Actinomadura sp.]